MQHIADCTEAANTPEGVLPCGCTNDVIERLWQKAGLCAPPGRSLWTDIEAHVAPHLGPFQGTVHDPLPGAVWGDTLLHGPTPERPSLDLVGAGMSAVPMRLPLELRRRGVPDRAELMLRMPPELAADGAGPGQILEPRFVWALRWMQLLPRLPHTMSIALADVRGLDISHRLIPMPSEPTHRFAGVLVADAARFGGAPPNMTSHPMARDARRAETKFLTLIPVLTRELDFAFSHGVDRLFRALREHGVDDIVRLERGSVV